jgi:hypothetical protein
MNALTKRKRDKTLLRVVKGALAPADHLAAAELRARGFRLGDTVLAEITKPRNPGFHRLAHQLGALLAENLDAFDGCDPHSVLKRLQVEGNIGCDEMAVVFPGIGPCTYRIPRSLSFASMDEGEFKAVITEMCRYVARTYWPGCTPEQIESMASAWVEAA